VYERGRDVNIPWDLGELNYKSEWKPNPTDKEFLSAGAWNLSWRHAFRHVLRVHAYAYTCVESRNGEMQSYPSFRREAMRRDPDADFPWGRAAIARATGTVESLLLVLKSAKKTHFSRRRVIDRQIQFRADNEMLPRGRARWMNDRFDSF